MRDRGHLMTRRERWLRFNHPNGFAALRSYMSSYRACGVRLRYWLFKRGYMIGMFGKGRWLTVEQAGVAKDTGLWWYIEQGWHVGREARYELRINIKPKGPGPRGDRRAVIYKMEAA